MFDFPVTQESVETCLYSIFLYALFFILYFKQGVLQCKKYNASYTTTRDAVVLIFFIISTNTLKGDFFHFMEVIHNYDFTPGAYNYGEAIYGKIAKIVNKNYLFFRMIVWGGAFLLFCLTAKRFKVSVYHAAVYLLTVFYFTFCYARVTAAMSVYFIGLSFLCIPEKKYKTLSYIIGVFLISLVPSFHNSAFILVLMTFVIFIPIRKLTIIALFIATPIILVLLSSLFDYFLIAENSNEIIAARMTGYVEREGGGAGIGAIVHRFFMWCAIYVPLFYVTSNIFFKRKFYYNINAGYLSLIKVLFYIVFVATCFYLLGTQYYIFFYRIMNMAMIPIALIIPKLYQDGIITRKAFILSVGLGVCANSYKLLYDLYNVVVQ